MAAEAGNPRSRDSTGTKNNIPIFPGILPLVSTLVYFPFTILIFLNHYYYFLFTSDFSTEFFTRGPETTSRMILLLQGALKYPCKTESQKGVENCKRMAGREKEGKRIREKRKSRRRCLWGGKNGGEVTLRGALIKRNFSAYTTEPLCGWMPRWWYSPLKKFPFFSLFALRSESSLGIFISLLNEFRTRGFGRAPFFSHMAEEGDSPRCTVVKTVSLGSDPFYPSRFHSQNSWRNILAPFS